MTNKYFTFNAYVEKNLIKLMNEAINCINNEKDKTGSYKYDGTIITKADKLVDNIIKNYLEDFMPNIPIISEEGLYKDNDFIENIYWLIDPIDGTSSYSKGGDEFTVNIALIQDGFPILGLIAHPPTNSIWFGYKNFAYKIQNGKKKILQTNKNFKTPKILISNNLDKHTKIFLKKIKTFELIKYSSSIKFCKIAEGEADFYPRLESINKWDIAAGDAILRAAGGLLLDNELQKYKYNLPGNLTGSFYAISSTNQWYKELVKII